MAAATATGFLELNIAGFDKAISTAKKALVALTAVFAVFKTVNFWKEGIEGAINFGNEIYHASQRIGAMDPGKLLIAQKTLENAGLGAEEARTQINELVESGRSMSTLFRGADDYAQALRNATASYGSQAKVLSQSAEKLSKVFEIIQSVGSKMQTFFLAMTAQLVVPLQAALRLLDQIDLAGVGESFGRHITNAVQVVFGLFKTGNVGLAIGLSLKIAFTEALKYLVEGVTFLFSGSGKLFFEDMVKRLSGIKDMFIGIAEIITSAIMKGIAKALRDLKVGGMYVTSHDELNKLNMAGNEMEDRGSKRISGSLDQFGPSGLAGALAGFAKGFTTDPEKAKTDLAAIIKEAMDAAGKIMQTTAGSQKKDKIMTAGLGAQDPYKVIASSMAKVGGGGGYMVQGMTIQARTQIKELNAANLANDIANKTLVAVQKLGPDKMKP